MAIVDCHHIEHGGWLVKVKVEMEANCSFQILVGAEDMSHLKQNNDNELIQAGPLSFLVKLPLYPG